MQGSKRRLLSVFGQTNFILCARDAGVFNSNTPKKAFSPSSAVKAAQSCAAKDDVLAASHLLFIEKPQHLDY